jgi:hypothetical protein
MLATAAGDLERRISQPKRRNGEFVRDVQSRLKAYASGSSNKTGRRHDAAHARCQRLLAMAAAKDAGRHLDRIGSIAPASGAEALNSEAPLSEPDDLSSNPRIRSRLRA